MHTIANVAIVIVAGLVLFLILGQLVDAVIFHVALGSGDPVENIIQSKPSATRHYLLNVLRPISITMVIFGGGLLTTAYLQLSITGIVMSCMWFFFLTQIACLAGRQQSLNVAGWAMVLTIAILLAAFIFWHRTA